MTVQQRAGARILLVDDEPDHVAMYRLALEDAGFAVMSASTGAAAAAVAREWAPHLIVLDVRLPDMSGWEVCRLLRGDRATAAIQVLILTAAAMPTLAADAERAGCAGCILKPCYPDQLVASIRTLLAIA